MSASKFDRSLDNLDEAINTQRLVTQTAKETVNRLLRTAFRDERAVERFDNQERMRGPARALAMAQGRDDLPRSLWLGALRGGELFNRAERVQAEAALAELPEAYNAFLRHRAQLSDMTNARLGLLRERDQAATWERINTRRQERDDARQQADDRPRTRQQKRNPDS